MKLCGICKIYKDLDSFNKDNKKRSQQFRQSRCRDCCKARNKSAENKAYYKRYVKRRWAMALLLHAKGSSKSRGHDPPEISEKWIEDRFETQDRKCYWTGVAMAPSEKDHDLFQPSLDRLDCSLGYTPENVVISSWGANRARGDASAPDFLVWLNSVRMVIQ